MASRIVIILLTLASIMVVPYLGAYYWFDGDFPTDYFRFPPVRHDKPGNSLFGLVLSAGLFALALLLYFFPKLFGFKTYVGERDQSFTRLTFPKWFWIGLVLWLVGLFTFAARLSEPRWLTDWAFLPLCWGFILFLDGLVYRFNHGDSLISNHLPELIGMAATSIPGWLIYEYLNFFIEYNWYYAHADLISDRQFHLYAVLGSSAFIPMAFEWYLVLSSVKVLTYKYRSGPSVRLPNWICVVMLLLALAMLFIAPKYPNPMFYTIWIAPVVIMAVIMRFLSIPTPFSDVRAGNWTFLLVFALTFLIQGALLEAWNFLSGYKLANGDHVSYNPSYWIYTIPFVYKYLVFEMPLFGYLGYLLFSIHCWLWWTIIAEVFAPALGLKFTFSLSKQFR